MRAASHLALSPLQGSELNRVRFWHWVMSPSGWRCRIPAVLSCRIERQNRASEAQGSGHEREQ